jgi:hypothetical protein
MGRARQGRYALDQSPLYKVTSKRKLAALLQVSVRDLQFLASLSDNYRAWTLPQKRQEVLAGMPAKKPRSIQQPKPLLDAVHRRISALLSRIQKPGFVYSATKGLDYVDNARQHMNAHRGVKVDIKDFYPSVRSRLVRTFFEEVMRCAPDVARLLTRICCAGDVLPTGSSVSPLLSYFACSRMFARIAALAERKGMVFTLYVDDMMFSGEEATRQFASEVVRELAAYGFVGHKISYFPPGSVKVVTGVAVWHDRVSLPRRRYRKMRIFRSALDREKSYENAQLLAGTLMGQYREAERLHPGSRAHASVIQARLELMRAKMFGPLTAVPAAKVKKAKRPIALNRAQKSFLQLRERLATVTDVSVTPVFAASEAEATSSASA